jgi:hypothetical protein
MGYSLNLLDLDQVGVLWLPFASGEGRCVVSVLMQPPDRCRHHIGVMPGTLAHCADARHHARRHFAAIVTAVVKDAPISPFAMPRFWHRRVDPHS